MARLYHRRECSRNHLSDEGQALYNGSIFADEGRGMRHHTLLISLGGLALLLWLGLFAFMNDKYPDSLNQVIFLAIWLAAVSCTVAPIAYLVNARAWGLRSRPRMLRDRALRQGLLTGLLTTVLMALRFLRMLTPVTAIPLILVTALVEVLANVRRR